MFILRLGDRSIKWIPRNVILQDVTDFQMAAVHHVQNRIVVLTWWGMGLSKS